MSPFSSTEDFIEYVRHFNGYSYGQHIYGFNMALFLKTLEYISK